MTKKDFIWLVIRSVGFFKAIPSIPYLVNAIGSFIIMLTIFPAHEESAALVLLGLSGVFQEGAVKIVVVIYLLFFGKTIFNIVDRTSSLSLDTALEKPNYTEILIRFLGIWWLWRTIHQIVGLVSGLLNALILHHPDWLIGSPPDETTKSQTSQEFFSKLSESLHPLQQSMFWSMIVSILIGTMLAWYFLKNGRFFINLLNRLWQGKRNEEPIQNPVDSVNPV